MYYLITIRIILRNVSHKELRIRLVARSRMELQERYNFYMFLQRGLSTQGLQSELIVKKFERTLYEKFVSENLYFLIYSHYEVYNIEVI